MKILFVGGTWNNRQNGDGSYGAPSKIVELAAAELKRDHDVTVYNGGYDEVLVTLLHNAKNFDVVFWWPNVPNELPKNRDVKSFAPYAMLVTSKRNDNQKYTFMQLTQRALAVKANMTFEFAKVGEKLYEIRVFDPLGCQWYHGTDIKEAMQAAMTRLAFLRSVTRQRTVQSFTAKETVMKYFFEKNIQAQVSSEKQVEIPGEQEFINIVRSYAERFHEILNPGVDIKRFLGNASLRPKFPPQVGRCSKGFPSFKSGDYIFMSQRNVDKQFLDISHFVPCYMGEDGTLCYCGKEKPSVDTPIQMRLYQALPNIRYIIHSHCYIEGAPFTKKPIPCGAVEEVDEVMELIQNEYGCTTLNLYTINLKGHGSLLMAGDIDQLRGVQYYGRALPETVSMD